MKRKITAYIILCSLWIIPAGVVSQDFSQALGLRGGSSSGISYKSYMGNLGTLHGLLSFRNDGIQAHVLIEKYKPVFEEYTNDLFLFTGFGGHVGFSRWYQREAWDDTIKIPTIIPIDSDRLSGLMLPLDLHTVWSPFP